MRIRYPTGLLRYVLWAFVLLLCFGLALVYDGYGLVMDWLIISAVLIWRVGAMKSV